jgi:hypothetical protein
MAHLGHYGRQHKRKDGDRDEHRGCGGLKERKVVREDGKAKKIVGKIEEI